MEPQSIYTVLITLITVLGSGAAWKFYENRAQDKKDEEIILRREYEDRINKLESRINKYMDERDSLLNKILDLTEEVSALRTKVEFLENGKHS